jgi:hypothetical protein
VLYLNGFVSLEVVVSKAEKPYRSAYLLLLGWYRAEKPERVIPDRTELMNFIGSYVDEIPRSDLHFLFAQKEPCPTMKDKDTVIMMMAFQCGPTSGFDTEVANNEMLRAIGAADQNLPFGALGSGLIVVPGDGTLPVKIVLFSDKSMNNSHESSSLVNPPSLCPIVAVSQIV